MSRPSARACWTWNRNRMPPSPTSAGRPAILPVSSRSRPTRVSGKGPQRTWQTWTQAHRKPTRAEAKGRSNGYNAKPPPPRARQAGAEATRAAETVVETGCRCRRRMQNLNRQRSARLRTAKAQKLSPATSSRSPAAGYQSPKASGCSNLRSCLVKTDPSPWVVRSPKQRRIIQDSL